MSAYLAAAPDPPWPAVAPVEFLQRLVAVGEDDDAPHKRARTP